MVEEGRLEKGFMIEERLMMEFLFYYGFDTLFIYSYIFESTTLSGKEAQTRKLGKVSLEAVAIPFHHFTMKLLIVLLVSPLHYEVSGQLLCRERIRLLSRKCERIGFTVLIG